MLRSYTTCVYIYINPAPLYSLQKLFVIFRSTISNAQLHKTYQKISQSWTRRITTHYQLDILPKPETELKHPPNVMCWSTTIYLPHVVIKPNLEMVLFYIHVFCIVFMFNFNSSLKSVIKGTSNFLPNHNVEFHPNAVLD